MGIVTGTLHLLMFYDIIAQNMRAFESTPKDGQPRYEEIGYGKVG